MQLDQRPTAALIAFLWAGLLLTGCSTRPDRRFLDLRESEARRPRLSAGGVAGRAGASPMVEELRRNADLDRYLRFGLEASASLKAAYDRWVAELERVPQVETLPDPVLSFGQFLESIETRTGPQRRRYSLQQTLPWFGKLSTRADAQAAIAESMWFEVVRTQLMVEREITIAYFDYAYLAESTRITGDALTLLRQIEPIVRQRIAAGTAGQADLLRLQVEIGRLENELESRRQIRRSLSARLASAMSLDGSGELPWPDMPVPADVEPVVDFDALFERATETNPELRALQEGVRRQDQERELASLQRWPDLTLGVDYVETGSALAPTPDSGNDPIAVRLSLNLPIWLGKYSAAEREAERRTSAARHRLKDREFALRADLEHAAFEFGDAWRQLRLYADSLLPRARESLEITRSAYRAGRSSLLDVIDSERALLDFETGFLRACRDLHQSRARLETLLGGSL